MQRPSDLGEKQSMPSFIDRAKDFCRNSKNVESLWWHLKHRERRAEIGLTSSGLHFGKIVLSTIWKTDGRSKTVKSLIVYVTCASEIPLKRRAFVTLRRRRI